MVDLLLPDVRVAKISPQLIDNTARFSSPLTSTMRSVARPGDRWGFQLDYQNLLGVDRARLESFIANMRGAANLALYSPGDYVQRGTFPSAELFSNNSFINGATGWSVLGSALSYVVDRVMRVTATASGTQIGLSQSPTLVQYVPYIIRSAIYDGAQSAGLSLGPAVEDGIQAVTNYSAARGLITTPAMVSLTTSGTNYAVAYLGSSGYTAGEYITLAWCSLSRCMLVDNGPNLLLQSDTPGGASWGTNAATAAANGTAGPDGSADAFYLAETTANSTHHVFQTVAVASLAADYTFSAFIAPINRSWCFLQISEGLGGTSLSAYFNASTGAVGTVSTGANWSNSRTSATNYGNGWWKFTITARKTNAATSLTVFVVAATANGTNSYTGVASPVALLTWRASLAQSAVPLRSVPTAGSPTTGAAQTGSGCNVKGLPASTNGLLLTGDWIEINKELKRVTTALNSDAAGLGYLQFSPPLRNSPADNDPVIVNMPMGRFLLKNPANGWVSSPAYFANSSLVLEEAP